MGHDVYGYKGKLAKGQRGTQIAYLRIGAFNNQAREIYKALDAVEYDNGVSGSGETKYFTPVEIQSAIKKLPQHEDLQEENDFLTDCLNAGEEGVTIGFY